MKAYEEPGWVFEMLEELVNSDDWLHRFARLNGVEK